MQLNRSSDASNLNSPLLSSKDIYSNMFLIKLRDYNRKAYDCESNVKMLQQITLCPTTAMRKILWLTPKANEIRKHKLGR